MPAFSFKTLRVTLLLAFLATAAVLTHHQITETRSWSGTLDVVVFPINGDAGASTGEYIDKLDDKALADINFWFAREAKKYRLQQQRPVNVRLGPEVNTAPPRFPTNTNAASVLFWGLRFRWWAFRNTPKIDRTLTTVRLFVMYYQGENDTPLQHSLGMQKGLLGLVHAFAIDHQTAQNNIVIAHELLHTVGAIDKYVSWGAPAYPAGYADPRRQPLFPQQEAEIMAGRIPVSHQKSYMPSSLRSVVINNFTASEINWLKP